MSGQGTPKFGRNELNQEKVKVAQGSKIQHNVILFRILPRCVISAHYHSNPHFGLRTPSAFLACIYCFLTILS